MQDVTFLLNDLIQGAMATEGGFDAAIIRSLESDVVQHIGGGSGKFTIKSKLFTGLIQVLEILESLGIFAGPGKSWLSVNSRENSLTR